MSEALPYVGAAVGAYFGQPQLGWAIGSVFSMALAPAQKSQGPKLDDLKVVGLAYGQPIPYIQGTHRTAGQLIWSSDRREIATQTEQGKGGPRQENTTYTYEVDQLFLLSSNELAGLLRVWDNGKLVFTSDANADSDSLIASQDTGLWRRITFYGGGPSQMPDPTYESAVGVGNAPAYRDMGTVFIEGLQLGQSGQQPNLSFEVGTNTNASVVQNFQDFGPSRFLVRRDYLSQPASVGFVGVFANQGPFGPAGLFSGNFFTPKQGLGIGTVPNVPSLGTRDFTFQTFLKSIGGDYASARGMIVANGISNGSTLGFRVLFDEFGALTVTIRQSEWNYNFRSVDAIFPLGVTFHLAVIREGSRFMAFINGFLVLDEPIDPALNIIGSELWELGGSQAAQANWQGYMSDASLAAIALHSQVFNVPTQPYIPDQNTLFWIPFYRIDVAERGTETVRTVVERLCARADLPVSAYDASALDAIVSPVRALAITQVGGTRATLELLAQAYHFQMLCTDRIYFVPRAQGIVAEIPYRDLGAAEAVQSNPDPFALRQRSDIEVPAQESITYANVNDDYQSDTQTSDRLLTEQTNTVTTTLPLALTPSEAKAIADARVTDGAMAAWSSELSLPRSYARLTPGDSVLVEQKSGSVFRMLLGRLKSDGITLSFEARLEDPTVFLQSGITGEDYNPQTVVVAVAGTYLLMLDIPQLRDADNAIGLYSVARGLAPNWPGANVFESTDTLSWESRATISETAVLGSTLSALGNWTRGNVFDETSTVDVNVGPGTLSSATRNDVLNDRLVNAVLVGDEVLQYCVATALGGGVYRLSRFLRGRLGTDRVTTGHVAGERFVLLQPPGMRRINQNLSDLATVRYFKGVSIGRALSTAPTQEMVNRGVSSTPLAPVNARANRNAADTVITWQRRTRMETRFLGPLSSSVPLGEAFEAYQVDIYTSSAFTTVVRTLTVTTPSAVYTAAQQTTDFGSPRTVLYVRIYQMSEAVGRGFSLTAII